MRNLGGILAILVSVASILVSTVGGEPLSNGGFESLEGWLCNGFTCSLTTEAKRSGQYGVLVSGRSKKWMGPGQFLSLTCGQPSYQASGYVKLTTSQGPQTVQLVVDFTFTDGSHQYDKVDVRNNVQLSDGWVLLTGSFSLPTAPLESARVYFSGPDAGVEFAVDDASVIAETCQCDVPLTSDQVIEQLRKSDININVTTASTVNRNDIQIQVVQLKKSFPFGMAVNADKYNENAAGGKYRDIIHQFFNWAVLKNALKWPAIEWRRGVTRYDRALEAVNRLRSNGLKVRGHALVWSVPKHVQGWVQELAGQELRDVVQQHIEETMNMTRGLLEHWDVNNENLHGQWYQDRLQDPDYHLELFRMAHHHDPAVKLFLNDFNVVANDYSTEDYLQQAREVSGAYVGLHAMGVQCHFGDEVRPDPALIKQRLDILAKAGLPIWATELDVQAQDEQTRADYYEAALKALYGHPAVEGILFWGFWDQLHWRGEKAALAKGDNLEPTAAGLRVMDLLQNQWMTRETRDLAESGDLFAVRGFHGDYEVRVYNQGTEMIDLRKTFTLGKKTHNENINIA